MFYSTQGCNKRENNVTFPFNLKFTFNSASFNQPECSPCICHFAYSDGGWVVWYWDAATMRVTVKDWHVEEQTMFKSMFIEHREINVNSCDISTKVSITVL